MVFECLNRVLSIRFHLYRSGHYRANIFFHQWWKNPSHPLCVWSFTQFAMKQYVIDELRAADHIKIKKYLEETYGSAEMGAVYWVELPEDKLNEIQRSHADCQPFYLALELSEDRCALELLVRTKNRVRCACIGYASNDQRSWILEMVDAMFEKLNIAT